MALIPKRASASLHRCHSDPAILRYALKGTSKSRHVRGFLLVVTRTAGLTFRLHCRTYGGARTNALAIGNNVCIEWRRLLLSHRRRDGSVVSSLHCMNDPQSEGHMASHIGRRKFLATLGGAAAWPLRTRAEQVTRPVVGFLNSASANKYACLAASFRQGLSDLGLVDGRTSRSNIAGQRANMIDCLLITTAASCRSDRWVRRTSTHW